jgi:hypothetical protein
MGILRLLYYFFSLSILLGVENSYSYINYKCIGHEIGFEVLGGLFRAIPYGKSPLPIHPRLLFLSMHTIREGILTMIKYALVAADGFGSNDECVEKFSFFMQVSAKSTVDGIRINPLGMLGPRSGRSNNYLAFMGAIVREGIY